MRIDKSHVNEEKNLNLCCKLLRYVVLAERSFLDLNLKSEREKPT